MVRSGEEEATCSLEHLERCFLDHFFDLWRLLRAVHLPFPGERHGSRCKQLAAEHGSLPSRRFASKIFADSFCTWHHRYFSALLPAPCDSKGYSQMDQGCRCIRCIRFRCWTPAKWGSDSWHQILPGIGGQGSWASDIGETPGRFLPWGTPRSSHGFKRARRARWARLGTQSGWSFQDVSSTALDSFYFKMCHSYLE